MSLVVQEVEEFQNQHCWKDVDYGNEEERELEEALSLSDLPISTITIGSQQDEAKEQEEEDQNAGDDLDNDFDFGSLVGSTCMLDGGEMCIADEVFSGGQILPYRNSVSSMSGLRSVSRSDSMDRRGFASRSSSSRSSSIRSHYSNTSSSGSSSCSSNITTISAKTFPLVSQAKVQNQFHSYPSPRPQILGSATRLPTYMPPVGKKSKMWEVLKLGLVRTPEIELQDLKLRHRTNNNIGKAVTIPRNNSTGSSSSRSNNNNNNNNKADDTSNSDRARKSCSVESNRINSFILEMQKRKNQMSGNKNINGTNGGFFKSCKCSVGAIEPIPSTTRSNYGNRSGRFSNRFGNNHNNSSAIEVLREDKNSGQKNVQKVEEHQKHQQQQQQKRSRNLRQGKQVTSHQHHHRTFEWLRNLSHASVLNDS